jgi:small subunit ribosomal protein S9
MADEPQDTPQDEPAPEEPTAEQPAAEEPEATPEQPEAEAPAEETPAEEETPVAESDEEAPAEAPAEPEAEAAAEPEASEAPAEKPKPKRKKDAKADEPEVIPGAHLEPDLVLEEEKKSRAEESGYVGAEVEIVEEVVVDGEAPVAEETDEDEAPKPLEAVLNLAADARYRATGKRKSAVARVTLKPGTGVYTINGKSLNEYFPRPSLQTKAKLPLETVGQQERMDVVAKIHGGGVSAQAGALRHGITRALVEADPNLRGELKRRGFLTRDPRVKERKKAGFKKARKRPQFSKR